MLPKKERLSAARDIRETLKARQYEGKGPLLYYSAKDNNLPFSRFCIVTKKQLGNAVKRNRIRRFYYDTISNIMHNKGKKVDMVVIPRSIKIEPKNEISTIINGLFEKFNIR